VPTRQVSKPSTRLIVNSSSTWGSFRRQIDRRLAADRSFVILGRGGRTRKFLVRLKPEVPELRIFRDDEEDAWIGVVGQDSVGYLPPPR
jgi:hypothetical protein